MKSTKREEYLRKAKEADEEKLRAKGQLLKEAWERIAAGYLELAERNDLDRRSADKFSATGNPEAPGGPPPRGPR